MTNSSNANTFDFQAKLREPVSIESLAVLRILFGVMMAAGTIRFLLSGWVEELFIRPTFFFKYPGFEWMPVWGPTGLYIHMGIVLAAALCVALGLFYRLSILLFTLSFLGIQLFDAANYLNHYYLVLCISLIMLVLPANAAWSLDVKRDPSIARSTYPAWGLYLLRFQVSIVYIFAAVAKLGTDWLMHAQPLSIWLSARADMPIIGSLFALPETAFIMSWGGLIYDATIVFFLLWRRTRALAYLAVLGFHAMTFLLFDIGMFPIIMVVLTTIFFTPNWPTKLPKVNAVKAAAIPDRAIGGFTRFALLAWCGFHLLFPFRHLVYPHDVLWAEQGMRYSWRVMVREKMGSVTYLVERISDGRIWEVNPARYLEPRQLSEISGQPDMIEQLAYHIRDDFERRKQTKVRVRVRALASLNGRQPAPMIDPEVDLTGRWETKKGWLIARPDTPPLSPWGRR